MHNDSERKKSASFFIFDLERGRHRVNKNKSPVGFEKGFSEEVSGPCSDTALTVPPVVTLSHRLCTLDREREMDYCDRSATLQMAQCRHRHLIFIACIEMTH